MITYQKCNGKAFKHPVPASKEDIVIAVKRMIKFLDDRKIKSLDDLASTGKRFAQYPDGDAIMTTSVSKKSIYGEIYTIYYVSKAKGGRIFEARGYSNSMDIIFTAKALCSLPGYRPYEAMGKSGKDDYGCIEQSKMIKSPFGIPVIKGELISLKKCEISMS